MLQTVGSPVSTLQIIKNCNFKYHYFYNCRQPPPEFTQLCYAQGIKYMLSITVNCLSSCLPCTCLPLEPSVLDQLWTINRVAFIRHHHYL